MNLTHIPGASRASQPQKGVGGVFACGHGFAGLRCGGDLLTAGAYPAGSLEAIASAEGNGETGEAGSSPAAPSSTAASLPSHDRASRASQPRQGPAGRFSVPVMVFVGSVALRCDRSQAAAASYGSWVTGRPNPRYAAGQKTGSRLGCGAHKNYASHGFGLGSRGQVSEGGGQRQPSNVALRSPPLDAAQHPSHDGITQIGELYIPTQNYNPSHQKRGCFPGVGGRCRNDLNIFHVARTQEVCEKEAPRSQ